jgi:maleamate amidohydrolase
MASSFEDRCWKDVIPSDVLELYAHYERPLGIGPAPALLAIDLYEFVYQGGSGPIGEVSKIYPSSCAEYAWAAIEPTKRLFAAVRRAHIPVFYSTGDERSDGRPKGMTVTKRPGGSFDAEKYAIRPEFKPQSCDVVIRKQRASAFFGTPLVAHLTQLGIRTLIVCGESTSGCVRATVADAYSYGFQVVLIEECCFDRNLVSHKVSLFDMHHKYADVLTLDEVLAHLEKKIVVNPGAVSAESFDSIGR